MKGKKWGTKPERAERMVRGENPPAVGTVRIPDVARGPHSLLAPEGRNRRFERRELN